MIASMPPLPRLLAARAGPHVRHGGQPAFPDDARIAAAMGTMPAARALPPQELRIHLKDDRGGGRMFGSGPRAVVVAIEQPPFHARAMRMGNTDGAIDDRM